MGGCPRFMFFSSVPLDTRGADEASPALRSVTMKHHAERIATHPWWRRFSLQDWGLKRIPTLCFRPSLRKTKTAQARTSAKD